MKTSNDFFHFSRRERLGVFALSCLSLFCILLPYFWRRSQYPPDFNFTAFKAEIAAFKQVPNDSFQYAPFNPNHTDASTWAQMGIPQRSIQSILRYLEKGGKFKKEADLRKIYTLAEKDFLRIQPYIRFDENRPNAKPKQQTMTAALFYFDPNTADASAFQQLGLREKTIKSILNYREKGGKFRSAADLAKIYSLPDGDFQRLKEYVRIEPSAPKAVAVAQKGAAYYAKREVPQIDINRSDAEAWQQLPGIGAARANKIVAYRDRLGGFVSKLQVAETYGLPDSVFQKIQGYFEISPIYKPVLINSVSREALVQHPYFSKKQADLLVSYREQHGPYHSMADFNNIPPLRDPAWQAKVRVYLSFE